ncbi:cysteine-rich CWC family protein [Noviherbaspirillum sp. CPCC 100848]|uniref:Cysteine-rich CWC family protein n=1 Tax=Noviherbaspirillum album TaxID=3080276 RepID=A0ABU6JG30_9BURK|nr:cysteine-rich CWC family protein [Noviherbaspirillum sp. CPCC 100848]MEC4722629.1 cysteine-rich CWC family protein [Noviherbaspirillum sp. CPCC 100848]
MSICSTCGAAFECGMADGPQDTPCWCTGLPPLPESYLSDARKKTGSASSESASCFCPDCLRALIGRARDHAAGGG